MQKNVFAPEIDFPYHITLFVMVSKCPGFQVSPPWSARQGQLLHVRGAKADPAGGARGQQAGAQGETGGVWSYLNS